MDSTEFLINGKWIKGSGPCNMPAKIAFHSMVNWNGDLYVIGGEDYSGHWSKEIYKFNGSYGIYQWTTLKKELIIPRYGSVAFPIMNSLVNCKANDSCIVKAYFLHVAIICYNLLQI